MQNKNSENGIATFLVAQEIAKSHSNLTIYVSHGNKNNIKSHNLKLHKTRFSLSEKKGNNTIIADPDIGIVKNDKLICKVEIEEKNTISPKKLFSDLIPYCFAERIFINGNEIKCDDKIVFSIIGYTNDKGQGKDKKNSIFKVLKKSFNQEINEKLEKYVQIHFMKQDEFNIDNIVKWIEENIIEKNG